MSTFTFETNVPVRFRDADLMGWVHNTVHLIYVEEARRQYFQDVLGVDIPDTNSTIASQTIEYAIPITIEDEVIVRYRVSEIGGSSITMAFEVCADSEPAAEGEVTQVLLDDEDTPRNVPDEWRERIRAFEDASVGGL